MNYLKYILSLLIFGSLGVFVKNINLSSEQIVFFRTTIASLIFMLYFMFSSKKLDLKNIRSNIWYLILSGFCVGFDVACLFEAYNYTSVSIATLFYYVSPIFIILLSPIFLKEKITFIKIFTISISLLGMYFISKPDIQNFNANYGVFLSILGAFFCAFQVIFNKKLKDIDTMSSTFVQLLSASFVMFIYTFIINKKSFIIPDKKSLILILILGVIHTAIAFHLYFNSIVKLPTTSVVVLSYVDPISSIIFASIFLNEKLVFIQIIGALLILSSTLILELYQKKTNIK